MSSCSQEMIGGAGEEFQVTWKRWKEIFMYFNTLIQSSYPSSTVIPSSNCLVRYWTEEWEENGRGKSIRNLKKLLLKKYALHEWLPNYLKLRNTLKLGYISELYFLWLALIKPKMKACLTLFLTNDMFNNWWFVFLSFPFLSVGLHGNWVSV